MQRGMVAGASSRARGLTAALVLAGVLSASAAGAVSAEAAHGRASAGKNRARSSGVARLAPQLTPPAVSSPGRESASRQGRRLSPPRPRSLRPRQCPRCRRRRLSEPRAASACPSTTRSTSTPRRGTASSTRWPRWAPTGSGSTSSGATCSGTGRRRSTGASTTRSSNAARARGLSVLGNLAYSPTWARPAGTTRQVRPRHGRPAQRIRGVHRGRSPALRRPRGPLGALERAEHLHVLGAEAERVPLHGARPGGLRPDESRRPRRIRARRGHLPGRQRRRRGSTRSRSSPPSTPTAGAATSTAGAITRTRSTRPLRTRRTPGGRWPAPRRASAA